MNLRAGRSSASPSPARCCCSPQILILDDSTSSVDVETETKIQDALEAMMQDRTSFVVAQRISTVLNADKIVVIDKGQIAAEGTHAELMQIQPDLPGNLRLAAGRRLQRRYSAGCAGRGGRCNEHSYRSQRPQPDERPRMSIGIPGRGGGHAPHDRKSQRTRAQALSAPAALPQTLPAWR